MTNRTSPLPPRRGLNLDKVVLLGRTLEEYRRFFGCAPSTLAGKGVLDVASGVSSFSAEICKLAAKSTAFDPIYSWSSRRIHDQCEADLDRVTREIGGLPTYRWDFYKNPEGMRRFRTIACQKFLQDFEACPSRYVSGALPTLPFESGSFDLSFVSYFLFVYEEQFGWEFHRDSILEIMRVTSAEARIYPLVTFEARPCPFVERLRNDNSLAHLRFKIVPTQRFSRSTRSRVGIIIDTSGLFSGSGRWTRS